MNRIVKFSVACLLALASVQAWAETATITFTGISGQTLVESDANTSWTCATTAQKFEWDAVNSNVKLTFMKDQSAIITGVIPANWQVTRVEFPGYLNTGISIQMQVGSNTGTVVSSTEHTFDPPATGNILFTLNANAVANGDKQSITFDRVIIEYTIMADAPPTLRYFNGSMLPGNGANPYEYATMPTSITVTANKVPYVEGGSTVYNSTNVTNFASLLDPETAEDILCDIYTTINAAGTVFTVNFDNSKLNYCTTYILSVKRVCNSAGVYIDDQYDWYFTTPSLPAANFTVTSKVATLYQYESYSIDDFTIVYSGNDITAQCTDFVFSTTNAGSQPLSFNYKGCTITKDFTLTPRTNVTVTFTDQINASNNTSIQLLVGTAVGTLPVPGITTASTDCGEMAFVGWSTTNISGNAANCPTLAKPTDMINSNTTYYAVYSDPSSDTWTKITSEAELIPGNSILIVAKEQNYALGAANTNNFGTVAVTKSGNTLSVSGTPTLLTLGGTPGAYTLKSGSLYLEAVSDTKNHLQLKSETTVPDNAKWNITIGSSASVVANGPFSRNIIRFNNGASPKLFSCYSGGQAEIDLYRQAAGHYITRCMCASLATPNVGTFSESNISASNATLSWAAVTGAQRYEVQYKKASDLESDYITVTTTNTTYAIEGLTKSTAYVYRVKAFADGLTYCLESAWSGTKEFNTTNECAFMINYQAIVGAATWLVDNCMTLYSGDEYRIHMTLPNENCEYWIGPGAWGDRSQTAKFGNRVGDGNDYAGLTLAILHESVGGKHAYPGEGAVGSIRAYNNNEGGRNNYWAEFLPDGYKFAYGLDAGEDPWNFLTFNHISGTTFETEPMTLPADFNTLNYYVGVLNVRDEANLVPEKSLNELMTQMPGLKDWNPAGLCVKYRMWDNSLDPNWHCNAVLMANLIYMNADNTTEFERSDYYVYDDIASIQITNNTPTKEGFQFMGWASTPDAVSATYLPGSNYPKGGSAHEFSNKKLYPVFAPLYTVSYNANGGSTSCESDQYLQGATVTVCGDVPTRTDYVFDHWSTLADGTGTNYAANATFSMPANDVTLYAQYKRAVRVYYELINATADGDCETEFIKVAGDNVVLCKKPTSKIGHVFEHWKVYCPGSGRELDNKTVGSSFDVKATDTEIKIVPIWNVPSRTHRFINQGGGVDVEVATRVGEEGSYITSPSNINGEIPSNCDGKQFIGWACFTMDVEDNAESIEEMLANQSRSATDFVLAGEQILIPISSADVTWYAVYAVPK